ncbi:hypothetical protein HRR80_004626 [Exophiala dermatitidis]|uniref:Uncharacterized protein n=1 Tax=Exophiala dermatitidis TaxID=5970 RepID=A0AAN6ETG9_EXODE|nr:hypothetical protein HRR73_004043 [Exophiala dermatitidis]KAJ4533958.1 hypothetical protein HRR76_005907 [Exophiala dermatitidis]KAJ4550112.1 hypothetical protein HRR77_003592 [Exophiala dermatitidis]KAJ4585837.1 hypothetical protein HRR82_002890 [Exophiala dermatitidis]KAJ4626952.1 hypothetical protein HRR86_004275 [Exophiala dermatitidis]
MADKKPTSTAPGGSSGAGKPKYISSSGHVLESPPLTARISRFSHDVYNFFGLYLVSLFSLDPYAAAEGSRFNTRQRRPNTNTNTRTAPRGGGGFGFGFGGRASGRGSGGGSGRRMGTVDDVRGPECGSCG